MCKILSRIKELADHEGITIASIERTIGASRGVISKAIMKGTDIQSKWLELICEKYPQYSPTWLITGNGPMMTRDNEVPSCHPYDDAKIIAPSGPVITELRPRIPIDAAAGALSFAIDSISVRDCEMLPLIPRFPKYDFTIIAKGDSMTPEISSGDELACRFIDQSGFIQWGRPHVLDTAQGVVVKRIFEQDDKVICRSANRDYPDFTVPKEDIYHIALVVGLIRQY